MKKKKEHPVLDHPYYKLLVFTAVLPCIGIILTNNKFIGLILFATQISSIIRWSGVFSGDSEGT